MKKIVIVHYAEIATKKGNRKFFERKLIENIKRKLGTKKVLRAFGRIIIEGQFASGLEEVPGIAYFAKAWLVNLELADIKKAVLKLADQKKSFKIITKRSNKQFKYTSMETSRLLGAHIVKTKKMKVDLTRPGQEIFVEITERGAIIYTEKTKGPGGLPVTTAGKLIALVSGGIDSPVAAFKMIKRGCKVILVHFCNEKTGVEEKISGLASTLAKYQGKTKVYIIPFLKLQKKVIETVPAKYRMLIYRRLMMSLAELIAKKERAKGIITGDSVGQVASQTLENLLAIRKGTTLPIYSPLIGMDKQEIIEIAKAIGSYDISILPYSDCCSYLIAEHPETKANPKQITELEKRLKIKEKELKEEIDKARPLNFP